MPTFRRVLRFGSYAAIVVVALVIVGLVVTQTAWFRDWLRGYAVRQASALIDGDLTIGRLDGDLWTGLQLHDVAIDQRGMRVVELSSLELEYSVGDFIRDGIALRRVRLEQPVVRLVREDDTWNVTTLFPPTDPDETTDPASYRVDRIELVNGRVTIDDPGCPPGTTGCLPAEIRGIDGVVEDLTAVNGETSVTLRDLSLETESPSITVTRLAGSLRVSDSRLQASDVELQTGASHVTLDADVTDMEAAPVVRAQMSAAPLALAEVGLFVPQLHDHPLDARLDLTAEGPLDALAVDFTAETEAGTIAADVVVDASGPAYGARGTVRAAQVDAGALLQDPALASRVTATSTFDLTGTGLEDLTGELALEMRESAVAGYRVDRVDLDATLRAGTADLSVEADAWGTQVAAQGVVDVADAADGIVRYDLRGDVTGLDLRALPQDLALPALATRIDAQFETRGVGPDATATVNFRRSSIEGATIEAGSTARVSLGTEPPTYAADLRLRDVDPERIGRAMDIEALADDRMSGALNVTLRAEGQGFELDTLSLDAEVGLDGTLGPTRIPSLTAVAQVQAGALRGSLTGQVRDVRPEVWADREDVAGRIDADVDVTFALPDVSDPAQLDGASGQAVVTIGQGRVGGFDLTRAVADLTLDEGRVTLQRLLVEAPAADLTASGRLAIADEHDHDLRYEVEVRDLNALARAADVDDVAGAAQVQGRVTGTPRLPRTAGTLQVEDLRYGDDVRVTAASADYDVVLPELDVDQLDARATVRASDVRAPEVRVEQAVLAATWREGALTFDTTITEERATAEAAGQLQVDDDTQLLLLDRLTVAAEGQRWALPAGQQARVERQGQMVSIENLTLESGPQRIAASGTLIVPDQEQPAVAPPADPLIIDASAVDLARLGDLLAPERGLQGRLDASVRVSGALTQPTATGDLQIANGGVDGYRFEALSTTFAYEETHATVDLRLQQDAASWLTAEGTVPLPADDETPRATPDWDLTVASTPLDLAPVGAFVEALDDVGGRVQIDARVTGPAAKPLLTGEAVLTDGALTVAPLNVTYDDITGRIRFAGDLVTVDGFTITDDNGRSLELTGSVALHGTTPQDLALTIASDRFQLMDNDLGRARLTSDVRVTGSLDAPRIEGEMALADVRVEIDQLLALLTDMEGPAAEPVRSVTFRPVPPADDPAEPVPGETLVPDELLHTDEPALAEAVEEAAPPLAARAPEGQEAEDETDPPAMWEAATLDLRIRVPDNAVLRADDLRLVAGGMSLGAMNITVGGDLQALKAAGEDLQLRGTVRTIRGQYDFQGRRFTLQRDGEIRFEGIDPTNPALDITATRDVAGVEARIRLHGTAEEPEITLSSQPALDEADVLALILFNRPIDDLGQGERTSLAQQAGAIVGARLADSLAMSLRDALDVDLLEIDVATPGGPRLAVGTQLSERVFVKFRQQVGAQDVSEFILEYQLLDFLRLQTSVTEGGRTDRSPGRRVERSGVDLLYFFVY
jgi:translocation and assembly module TamB